MPKTLVLAFDGTSNEFNSSNTNVAKLCALLENNNEHQMVYYQPGNGTYTDPGIRGRVGKWFAKTADLAFAWYLDAHVMDGYKFLMSNHLPGDSVVMFGFSRGAYTARALAGMLHSVGLLPKDNHEQVTFAYNIYKSQSNLCRDFKQAFCKPVDIKMLGAWDTVASVGAIRARTLPFTSDETIRVFRHAISLEEHRVRFNVTLWKPETEVTSQTQAGKNPSVKEMWFAGAHADVGGSAELDTAPASLANISFRWMLHEIESVNCVIFDNHALDKMKIPTDCVRRVPRDNLRSRDGSDEMVSGSEDSFQGLKCADPIMSWKDMDDADIMAGTHDELKIHPWWWLLQIPTLNGGSFDLTGIRRFPVDEERKICNQIHSSVRKRKQLVPGYEPRAHLPQNWEALVSDDP